MKTLCSITVVGLMVLLMAAPCAEAALDGNHLVDGNDLLDACRDGVRLKERGSKSAREAFNAGDCIGFLRGMIEMHGALESDSGSSLRPLFCLPGQLMPIIQIMRIVLHYLETHPERLHLQQRVLVIEAFRDAFPCPPAALRPQR